MTDKPDIRAVMGSAIMNAILDVNRDETGLSSVDPVAAQQALVIALAMIIEADPRVSTPKDVREASDGVGKQVRAQIKALRDEYERTGRRAWDSTPIAVQ